jgi:hypothetical protein
MLQCHTSLHSCRPAGSRLCARRASASSPSDDDEEGGQQAAAQPKVKRGQKPGQQQLQQLEQQLLVAGVSAAAAQLALARAPAAALQDPGRMLRAWVVLQEAIGAQQANALLEKPGGAYLLWKMAPETLARNLTALRQGFDLDARQLGLMVAGRPAVLNLNASRDLQPRLQQWAVLLGYEQQPEAVVPWALRNATALYSIPPDAEARLSALAGLFSPPLSRQQAQRLVQRSSNFAYLPLDTLQRKLAFWAAELGLSDAQLAKLILAHPAVITRAEASVAAKLRQLAGLLGVPLAAMKAAVVASPGALTYSGETLAARHAAAAGYAARSERWQADWQGYHLAKQLNLSVRLGSRSARLDYMLATGQDSSIAFYSSLKLAAASFHRRFPGYRDWRAAIGLPREEASGRLRSRLLPPA